MPPDDDPQTDALLRQVGARGPLAGDAMKRLHGTLRPWLFRRLRHKLRNADDVEDLVQTVLMRVWEHAPNYGGEAPARAWVGRIAFHALMDHLRVRYREKDVIDRDVELADDMLDQRAGTPVQHVVPLAVILHCYKQQWLKLLNERPRAAQAVYLKYVDDLSMEELAAHRGGTVEGTKEFLHRMRRVVRKFLSNCHPSAEAAP